MARDVAALPVNAIEDDLAKGISLREMDERNPRIQKSAKAKTLADGFDKNILTSDFQAVGRKNCSNL